MNEAFDPEEWHVNGDCLWGGYLNQDMTHALIAQFFDNDKAKAEEMIDVVFRACKARHAAAEIAAEADQVIAELLESLRAIIGEIQKYHPSFDARLFVEAERAIAKARKAPQ